MGTSFDSWLSLARFLCGPESPRRVHFQLQRVFLKWQRPFRRSLVNGLLQVASMVGAPSSGQHGCLGESETGYKIIGVLGSSHAASAHVPPWFQDRVPSLLPAGNQESCHPWDRVQQRVREILLSISAPPLFPDFVLGSRNPFGFFGQAGHRTFTAALGCLRFGVRASPVRGSEAYWEEAFTSFLKSLPCWGLGEIGRLGGSGPDSVFR